MNISVQEFLLTTTEIGMLVYWFLAVVVAFGVITISPEFMYSNYSNPTVISWNWSFFPIDLLFALTGLTGRFIVSDPQKKLILSTVSLTLMFCAGVMAISFWAMEEFYDLFWWGINIWLIVLAMGVIIRQFFNRQ